MAEAEINRKLIKRQYLGTGTNIEKPNKIAKAKNASATETVRQAIDAYNPDEEMGQSDLMDLVSQRLKSAIDETAQTRTRMEKLIKGLRKNG